MPLRRLCKAPNCTRYAMDHSSYCLEHQANEIRDRERREAYKKQGSHYFETARHGMWSELYGSPKWKKLREEQLKKQPLCEVCGFPANEVHHIKAHNGDLDLFFDPDNLGSLCHECHCRETRQEAIERKRQYREARRKLWY